MTTIAHRRIRFLPWTWLIAAASLVAGCAVSPPPPELPMARQLTRQQLEIYSNFELPREHRLFTELEARRKDVHETLGVPVSEEPIYVYLFSSADSYADFLQQRFPDFPHRRAFFVETDTKLEVFAYWGDRVAEDLRHEVAHGYLHAVVPGLPLWLDEGLAEYFEVPRTADGRHELHIRKLNEALDRGDWKPDLARLEQLQHPDQMAQQDYAESWAWVHWLLESSAENRAILRQYLARLRVTGSAPSLSQNVTNQVPHADQELVDWLRRLAEE